MALRYYFTFESAWRHAPLAYWVHLAVDGPTAGYVPGAPVPARHKGYAFLHVEVGDVDLQFSSLAQLQHFIEVMQTRPLPIRQQLTRKSGLPAGPNGHWLSRLPARLKSPRTREKLVKELRLIEENLAPLGDAWHRYSCSV